MRWGLIMRGLLPAALLAQLVFSAAHAAPAEPESTAAGGLEEIVVTATRRQERLQDVPIRILAFSQEKLDQEGLKSVDDLSRLSPGLNFQRNGFSSSGNTTTRARTSTSEITNMLAYSNERHTE